MYRSRRRRSSPLLPLIFLGMIAGIGFLIYDSFIARPNSSAPTPQPTAAVTQEAGTQAVDSAAPTPQPAGSPVPGLEPDIINASLFIPTAGIIAPIIRVYLDGTSWDITNLGMNVGHLQGTAWVDSGPGNIVLSGHVEMSDGRKGIFANIKDLKTGDVVILREGGEERRYAVTFTGVVEPDDLTPLYPTANERLTLITCGNYDFFQDNYLDRVVVVAERVT